MKNSYPNTSSSVVGLIIALFPEARPLIEYYKLKLILKKPWKIYASYEKGIYLILSGIGSYQSSGAMGLLHSYLQIPEHAFYFNLGVAGSSHS